MSSAVIQIFIIALILSGCFNTETKKSDALKSISRSEFSYRGAVERSIDLKFNVKKLKISEITAKIKVPQNYNGRLNYKWIIGSGLQISTGIPEGSIEITNSKSAELKISVTGFDTEPTKHIRFEIIGEGSKQRIFADGIVSNNQENSFEEIVKEIENYKGEHANEK